MRTLDVIATAVANTFRSKTRTALTILAIFVGAFTLTITTGLGTGINAYIDRTVAEIGSDDVMTVTHPTDEQSTPLAGAPQVYEPDTVTTGAGPARQTVQLLTADDLAAIADIDGVLTVAPVKQVSVDYVQAAGGTPYRIGVATPQPGVQLSLAAGVQPDPSSSALQLALPVAYVAPLGFADSAAAVGGEVTLGLRDAAGAEQQVTATVVGVSESSGLAVQTGASANTALTDALYAAHGIGQPAGTAESYASATVTFDAAATPTATADLQDRIAAAGYTATTLADSLGAFTAVIDAIVLILNAFAVIALLAAGFGIVNTLFMSVQERTREIGLMKAMGMGSGRIFGLFSSEATFIGLLGSLLGIGVGVLVGYAVGGRLATTLFSALPGLTLFGVDPWALAGIVVLVMAIAFLAGTLPAARAARQDPIASLRYE